MGISLSSRLTGVFLLLALNIVLSNSLSQSEFGRLMLIYTAVIFLGNIGTIGCHRLFISLVNKTENGYSIGGVNNKDFSKVISSAYFIAIIILSLAIIIERIFTQNQFIGAEYFSILIAAYPISLMMLETSKLIIFDRINVALLIQNSIIPALLTITYFILKPNFFIKNFSFILICITAFTLVISKVITRKNKIIFITSQPQVKNTLKKTLSFSIIVFSEMYFTWGINIFTGFFISDKDYAVLNVVQRISSALLLVLMVSNILTMPKFSLNKRDFKGLRKTHFESTIACFLLTMFSLLFLLYFLEDFLLFFGAEYIEHIEQYKYFLLIITFSVILGPSTSLLMMINKAKEVNIVNMIAIFISLPIVYLSFQQFELTGILYAIPLSLLISKLFVFILVIKSLYNGEVV